MAQNRIASLAVWIFCITTTLLATTSSLPSPPVIPRIAEYDAESYRLQDGDTNIAETRLDKLPTYLVSEPHDWKRETRAAVYGTYKRNEANVKHLLRIPATKIKPRSGRRQAVVDPPDSEDGDFLDSLEGNREAFLEILDDNAKRPHRKRPTRSHQSKIQLMYDNEAKRYIISEKSDEFN